MMMLGTVSAMRGTCSGSRTSDAQQADGERAEERRRRQADAEVVQRQPELVAQHVRTATTSTVRSGSVEEDAVAAAAGEAGHGAPQQGHRLDAVAGGPGGAGVRPARAATTVDGRRRRPASAARA